MTSIDFEPLVLAVLLYLSLHRSCLIPIFLQASRAYGRRRTSDG
jgi:hypothetical protein